MVKPLAHNLVYAGSSPATATKCRDSVTATPRDSKSDVLGSKQASLCQTILDFRLKNPKFCKLCLRGRMVKSVFFQNTDTSSILVEGMIYGSVAESG